MAIARKHLIDGTLPGCYHLVSRCVRRAFLCGDAVGHRRDWLRERIRTVCGCFAVESLSYAIMDNHFHLVVRSDPAAVGSWSDETVAERWATAHPRIERDGSLRPWSDAEIAALLASPVEIAKARSRLGSISWLMKAIKEPIARRANREDRATGHFWEGRFHSTALLDQQAVIACMVYCDLNELRARKVVAPEDSTHSSIADRCRARQRWRKATAWLQRRDERAFAPVAEADLQRMQQAAAAGSEHGLWIAPMARCAARGTQSMLDVDDYLTLVDETGRIIVTGKRGHIPAHMARILDRLQLDIDSWLDLMFSAGAMLGAAIGSALARAAEAIRRGTRWIRNTVGELYRRPTQT